MRGGNTFYSPIIRSQSSSEPEWGISLPSCQRLDRTGVGYFPSPGLVTIW